MESSEILTASEIKLIKVANKIEWKWSRKRTWKFNYWYI